MNEQPPNEGMYTFEADLFPPRIKASGPDPDWVKDMAQTNLVAVADRVMALIENLPPDDRKALLIGNKRNQAHPAEVESYNQLPLFRDIDVDDTRQDESTPMSTKQTKTSESNRDSDLSSSLTMREFYQTLTVKYNNDITLAIATWYIQEQGYQEVSYSDFEAGYKSLGYFGVDMPKPKILNDRIQNACKKGYIYRTEFGTYTIAQDGEERVEELKDE